MINKALKFLKEGTFLLHCRKKIFYTFYSIKSNTIYKKNPVENNKIFFMTYDSKYSCNLKYISDEIIRQKLPIKIVWVCKKDNKNDFPNEVKTVVRGSQEMFYEQSSSKIWFDNALNCVWYNIPKKKEQIYINTWHGSMGIKKLSGNKKWMRMAKKLKKITDYCIANSTFEENIYKKTFWPKTEYLQYGHARNDILFDTKKHGEIRKKVSNYFDVLNNDVKFMLYAPTFRDDSRTNSFNIDFSKLKDSLEKRFGGVWVILVRMHYKNRNIKLSNDWNDWLKDASSYPDMQELLAVVDSGITDYSSWAYDYVLTKRPLFIYANDIALYNNERGFYYPLEETPFDICKNNDELNNSIINFNMPDYLERCKTFLDDKGCYENGKATKSIVEFIYKLLY